MTKEKIRLDEKIIIFRFLQFHLFLATVKLQNLNLYNPILSSIAESHAFQTISLIVILIFRKYFVKAIMWLVI